MIQQFIDKYGAHPLEYANDSELNDILLQAFALPAGEMLDFLRRKRPNIVITESWQDLDSFAHKKAFTAAKVASADVLQELLDTLIEYRDSGKSVKNFVDDLLPNLQKAGWDGLSPSRLKLIYNTNSDMNFAYGRLKQQELLKNKYPYLRYSQIQRINKNHNHSQYDGKVFRADSPILKSIYPPSWFGCGCQMIQLSEEEVKAMGLDVHDGTGFEIDSNSISPFEAFKPDYTKYSNQIQSELKKALK